MNRFIQRSTCAFVFVITAYAPLVAQTYWWNDAVFYEVFVRSFYDKSGDGKGDFKGLTEKLDYLNDGDPNTKTDLGITGIWLMPISASPSYHGYDVTNYKSIESDYGTKQDFITFIDAAHERGINVIVDFVLNHSSNQHPWFQKSAANDAHYRNFYRWSAVNETYNGPWGQDVWHYYNNSNYYYGLFWGGMPDLNYEYQPVKDSLFAAATFWLEDMKVDGFRCDAVKYIYENGNQLENIGPTYEFWRDFRTHYKGIKPYAMAVGEAWDATSIILNYSQGDGFDFCFEFNLADAILNAVNNGNTQALASTVQSIYYQYPYLQFASFLSNHDQNRVIEALGNDVAKNKLAAALYLTLPGIPFLYYGEELGMKGKKPDEDIRRPMQWSAASHAGFSTATPWRSVNSNFATVNVATQQADSASLLTWYKKLIAIRNNEPALRKGDYVEVQTAVSGVFAFLRTYEEESVLVVINTTEQDANNVVLSVTQEGFTAGTKYLQDVLNNSGRSVSLINSQSLSIGTVKSKSASVYKPSTIVDVADLVLKNKLVYPNPVEDWLTVEDGDEVLNNILLFDVWGRAQIVEKHYANGFMQMNVSELASGIYYLSFLEGSIKRSIKIVKQ
jgi:alpha-amylase